MNPSLHNLPAELPDGWFVTPSDRAALLATELARELPSGHLLDGLALDVVAHRDGTDDILCRQRNHPNRFIVVHLTWLGRTEVNAAHPAVEVSGTFDEFLAYERDINAE
ncbi:hypothetical protein FHS27_006604 [Rhodopirellula rubra]|uniref:Uncharacterized protein n=1 Tax=Aporhodopirellula rubra TaxID=980271 RepID=A0A7W5HA53_9BACT|nr:hypothetical protein [Aporhodopirellula rubra]MBB3210756.1 hypothetical protein [Aporhodopirellula rubra]